MDKVKILRALSWNFVGVYGNQAVLFVVGIILARLLEPEDFGLIAMILVFYNFGQIFVDLGFNNAIIQRKTNTREDLSTLFYVNLIFGTVLFGLLFFSSDLIASFYEKAELVEITRVISLIFLFFALSSIQRTLVIKEMNFRFESLVVLVSSVASGIIAITLALNGFGVWSLVLKVVLQRLFETILYWLKRKWRPSPVFRINSIKKYLNFSLNITGATLLNGISQNIDKLIIGKIFSAQSLGFFDRAKKYNNLAQSNIALIFGKVMYPVFSDLQDDQERFNRIYNKTIQMVCFFTLPLFFILIVVARPLIVVLITDKWLASVTLLQILAVSGFTYPLSMIMVKAIMAKGRADLFFKLDLVKTVLYFAGILLGSLWGILGVVTAITSINFISLALNALVFSRLSSVKISQQLAMISAPLVTSSLMLVLLILSNKLLLLNNQAKLIALIGLGGIYYFLLNYLFNQQMLKEIKQMLALIKTINR